MLSLPGLPILVGGTKTISHGTWPKRKKSVWGAEGRNDKETRYLEEPLNEQIRSFLTQVELYHFKSYTENFKTKSAFGITPQGVNGIGNVAA